MTDFESAASEAEFVLRGTVEKAGASTVAALDADRSTIVFHVDEVLHSPPAFAALQGQSVTVRLRKAGGLKEGEKVVLSANGLLYAESVALREVAHHPVRGTRAALGARVERVKAARADAEMLERVNRADVIVRGRVSDVRLPQQPAAMLDVAPGQGAAISEHDPVWREAVIAVDSALKGDVAGETTVIFPASHDVAWADVPKFEAGQEGVFLLHRESDLPKGGAALLPVGHAALTSLDVRPPEDESRIRALVRRKK